MDTPFELERYLGLWYELGHYPSWYQPNDSYNTTAEYTLNSDGSVKVHNSTIINGQAFDSYGRAETMGDKSFRVEFPRPEVSKLVNSGSFDNYTPGLPANIPNYVIDQYWVDQEGNYCYAVVSDAQKKTLYLLSRTPHPSRREYDMLISYITSNYDRKTWVATPHY